LFTASESVELLNNPQELKFILRNMNREAIEEKTLVQELYDGEETYETIKSYGLLGERFEMYEDSYMMSPLGLCFTKYVTGFGSSKMLMEFIL